MNTTAPKVGLDDYLVKYGPDALAELIDAAPEFTSTPSAPDLADLGDGKKKWTAAEEREAFAQATAGQSEAKDAAKDPPPLALLVRRARERYELFRSADGVAFASPDRVRAFPIDGVAFRDQLYRLHEQTVSARDMATPHLISSAVAVLAANARTGQSLPVFIRSGVHADTAYVYRHDPEAAGEVVAVSASGWRTVVTPSVRFAVTAYAGTLPRPADTGDVDELRGLLNLEDPDQFPLVVAWLGAAVLSAWPTPILIINGEQGSAKSTAALILARLVDPAPDGEPLRGAPKDEETIAAAAKNAHMILYDNVSGVSNDVADLLCRVSTGGSFAGRTKYTTTDETRVNIRRPVIITAIDAPSLRPDLLERMLTVRLRTFADGERVTEAEIFARFDAARPRILAGLYAMIARGLTPCPDLAGMRLTRMADFSRFAARAVGRDVVESKLAAIADDNAAMSLNGFPWVPPLRDLMRHRLVPWTGTADELLEELEAKYREGANNRRGDMPKRWPGGPHILGGQLDRAAPALRTVDGIEVKKVRNKATRSIRITRREGDASGDAPNPVGASPLAVGASPEASPVPLTLLELLGIGQNGDA